jgi:hypothetical protein
MNRKNKHAEITTQQIVVLIILIASFAVVIFFLARLNLGKTTNDEVCHNSVVMRSSGFLTQQAVPLNCKTNYVCISRDGSCEGNINQNIIKVNTAQEFYGTLAELMADCWWMFGEGRVDYIGDKFSYDLYCSVCSQVVFDNSLEKIFPKTTIRSEGIAGQSANETVLYWKTNKSDFYEYLDHVNVSGKGITYLDYFLDVRDAKLLTDVLKSNNAEFGTINLESRYLVTMGEFSRIGDFQNILKGIGKGFLLFAVAPIPIVGGPLSWTIVASTLPGAGTHYLVGTLITGESGHEYLTPALIEASSEDYNKFKCGDITTLA